VRGIVNGHDLGLEGEFWTPLGLFGGAPLGDGTTYFYTSGHQPAVAITLAERDLPAFRRVWSATLPAATAVLERVPNFDALLVNEVTPLHCARWVDGLSVLIGDAAHPMKPTLGQGANSAMVDAAVLTIELAGPGPISEALQRYTARRRQPVRRVQDTAERLERLSRLSDPLRRAARDTVLKLLTRLPSLADRQATAAQQEGPRALQAAIAALQPAPVTDTRRE
jgi:2-polyprenyl-6-methoxyphenol hydroxylase-like FAD-dependent oxidoreductase